MKNDVLLDTFVIVSENPLRLIEGRNPLDALNRTFGYAFSRLTGPNAKMLSEVAMVHGTLENGYIRYYGRTQTSFYARKGA